jgi:glycosyltransferase involved in cell wall biosynthesis
LHTNKHRVLIYLDNPTFGGHEVTLLEALRGLTQEASLDLVLLLPQDNERLLRRLKEEGLDQQERLTIMPHRFHTEPGDVFRVLGQSRKVRQLRQQLRRLHPDLVIVSQGAIALSACGLGAARAARIPLMSFLPMAHPAALVRNQQSLAVRLQDWLYGRLYALPDYFFTICETAKAQLHDLHKVPNERIFVHYFGLDFDRSEPLCLPKQKQGASKQLALIGRIEMQQKRHDFFLQHLAAHRDALPPLHVHIIGDGPDRARLEQLVAELHLGEQVSFVGWVDDMATWYQQLDAVLLPSRFEGVPVVMLEAMRWGLPVLASNRDGMAELLPKDWLFPGDDGLAMIRCLQNLLTSNQEQQLRRNRQIVDKMDIASFRAGFCQAVWHCLEKD